MMRILLIVLISYIALFGGQKHNKCKKRGVITLFENKYEKIFSLKGNIYKIIKGNDRTNSTFLILDDKIKKFIQVDTQKKDDGTIELLR
jgi:hypothetical protein